MKFGSRKDQCLKSLWHEGDWSMSRSVFTWDYASDEWGVDGEDCPGNVASRRKIAGVIRSLINSR